MPDASAAGVREMLERLGADASVHGIILQQPLPRHLDIRQIADAMPPDKDVDGANPLNQGRLAFGSGSEFVPATPAAVMLLLERSTRWPLAGVRACMVGPLQRRGSARFIVADARKTRPLTVTHGRTRDLARPHARRGSAGRGDRRTGLIRAGMVMPGATVIDVGTTFVDGKLAGDVAYAEVAEVAGEITPVPGGVGPVTNVALMRNVVLAAERLAALGNNSA